VHLVGLLWHYGLPILVVGAGLAMVAGAITAKDAPNPSTWPLALVIYLCKRHRGRRPEPE
jgi:hypothetical protein